MQVFNFFKTKECTVAPLLPVEATICSWVYYNKDGFWVTLFILTTDFHSPGSIPAGRAVAFSGWKETLFYYCNLNISVSPVTDSLLATKNIKIWQHVVFIQWYQKPVLGKAWTITRGKEVTRDGQYESLFLWLSMKMTCFLSSRIN